jgi:hypothetical protein
MGVECKGGEGVCLVQGIKARRASAKCREENKTVKE